MKYKIAPFPAVRVNSKWWRFIPRALIYHSKVKQLRALIWEDKEKLIKLILSWDYCINFYMPLPKSWSEKYKKIMNLEEHKTTPDIDNLFKAVIDTIFYDTEYNDKAIWTISCTKLRSDDYWIEFSKLNWDLNF